MAICVGCEQEITADNGPLGTYDGQYVLCGPCGDKVREIQKVAKSNQANSDFKKSREAFLKKYPSFVTP